MKPAPSVRLWAAIIIAGRTEWIHYGTIARTSRDARRQYLDNWDPEYRVEALKRVRFARVIVSLAPAP